MARAADETFKLSLLIVALCALSASASWTSSARVSAFAARRAADDSRPLVRVASPQARADAAADQHEVVVGKFRAPAPERIYRTRIPKSSQMSTQTLSASFRVVDEQESNSSEPKLVHGIVGASTNRERQQPQQQNQRTVGAKFQVSDEGLNYPPSKLSADIYGNVAEIVTAPPEAVDSDFLLPNSRRFSG